MTTKRQQYWAQAAKEEANRNPLAATLFALLAQPSQAEQYHEQLDARPVTTETGKEE